MAKKAVRPAWEEAVIEKARAFLASGFEEDRASISAMLDDASAWKTVESAVDKCVAASEILGRGVVAFEELMGVVTDHVERTSERSKAIYTEAYNAIPLASDVLQIVFSATPKMSKLTVCELMLLDANTTMGRCLIARCKFLTGMIRRQLLKMWHVFTLHFDNIVTPSQSPHGSMHC